MIIARWIRAFIAVIFAALYTAIAVSTMFTFGPVFRLICWPFSWRNPVDRVPAWWGHMITEICYEKILGMTVHRGFQMRSIDQDRPIILMCNHPTFLTVPFFVSMAAKAVGPHLVGVARWEMLFVPFVGWPLWIMNAAIFIKRDKKEEAFDELRRAFPIAARRGAAIYIFPDKHRPTYDAIARDRVKYYRRIKGMEHWHYTPVPRTGGMSQLLHAAGPHAVVVNMTIGCSVYDGDALRPDRLVGEKLFAIARNRRTYSSDPALLEQQLNAEWARKNRILRHWRSFSAS